MSCIMKSKVFHCSGLFLPPFGMRYESAVWFFRKKRLNLGCNVIVTEGGKFTAIYNIHDAMFWQENSIKNDGYAIKYKELCNIGGKY